MTHFTFEKIPKPIKDLLKLSSKEDYEKSRINKKVWILDLGRVQFKELSASLSESTMFNETKKAEESYYAEFSDNINKIIEKAKKNGDEEIKINDKLYESNRIEEIQKTMYLLVIKNPKLASALEKLAQENE